jgi:hypothetical protein
LVVAAHEILLSHLHEFGQHVVAFGAVFGQLVIGVALEHVRTCREQLLDNVKKVAVRS